jgi:hypothetical protein
MKVFDTVELLEDLPEHGLKAGAVGTILEVFESPLRAYEVEFANERGATIAELALEPGRLRLRPRAPE